MAYCKKVSYAKKEYADFAINKINKKSIRDKKPIRAYLCKCGSWHLTSIPDYKGEIDRLNIQLKSLIEENLSLKSQIKIENKELKHEIKVDERVQRIRKQLNTSEKEVHRLRVSNNELICKIVQLTK